MSRKETPDILGALMGEAIKQETQIAGEQESQKASETAFKEAVKQESKKAINTATNKTPKQLHFDGVETPEDVVDLPTQKEKATFNLSKAALSDLEDIWIEIRKLRGDKKISKTDIVEQALEDAIKEFRLKRETGKFYGRLESNKAVKQ